MQKILNISALANGAEDGSAVIAAAAKSSYVCSGSAKNLKNHASAFFRPRSVSSKGGFFFKTGVSPVKNNGSAHLKTRADFLFGKIARVFKDVCEIAPLGKAPALRLAAKRRAMRPHGAGVLFMSALAQGRDMPPSGFLTRQSPNS